jgi:hypothetical protein
MSKKEDFNDRIETGPRVITSLETFDGANKKPFKATGLLNKSQLKLASYIKANKDVTLQGTKRFMDKSGEYYLKNIQLQNSKQDPNSNVKKNSLNNPQNLENCLNRDINKIKKRASKIVTLLPENSLTPIPKKEGINKAGLANKYGKKELDDAQRTAVFIRRMEYATSMKRQMNEGRNMKNHGKKIAFIQEWWRTMFKIIKLQKNIRGYLFRTKLMSNLEHQEKLLQFITEFDNIYNYHLFKQFMENLKRKRDCEKAKMMEKCEDFNEKLDNLEKMHNYKNFKNCFEKWKNDTKKKKKALENFAKKLFDILKERIRKNNLDVLKNIRDKNKSIEDRLNDQAKEFRENNDRKKFMEKLLKSHRLNEKLSNVKKSIDNRLKKEFLDKLRNIRNKEQLKETVLKWRNLNRRIKERDSMIDDLKKYQQNELKKKAEEEKKKLEISSGVNDFELLSNKKETPKKKEPILPTTQNDINLEGKPLPKMIFAKAEQNFSLIAPEIFKFEFDTPIDKCKNSDPIPLYNQLDDLEEYRNERKIKRDNDIAKAVDILDKLINKKLKEKLMNNLKKLNNTKKGLDLLDKIINNKLKKDTLNYLIRRNRIGKACDKLEKLMADKLKKKFLDRLAKLKNNLLKKQVLESRLKNADKGLLKHYFDIWRENAKKKPSNESAKSKRISRRVRPKKYRSKSRKNNNKKLMKDAFDIWRENASFEPTRSVLDKIKKNKLLNDSNDNKKNKLIDKYKNKMMQVLLNIYQRQKNLKLKKYLDKWRKVKNLLEEPEKIEPKYKKKPRIGGDKNISDIDENSFTPSYYNQKHNLYTKKDSPYKKKYAQKPLEPEPEKEPQDVPKDKEYSDTSSNNESAIGNGEYLIQNTKVIKQPRNYTSQSFFIDKNKANNSAQNNYQLNTHNPNQLPMTMKGDFVSLIEQNPKILTQKNPRIQVTNAMCDIEEIMNNENTEDEELNTEEFDNEITRLNEDFVIDKNKVLSKVIRNCDKDLYASQKPFRTRKDQYYSVSIPLNDNEAKWEFLNNIKGERDKNNLNKFELIQKEAEPIIEVNEEKETPHKKLRSDKKNQNSSTKDNSYKLREMNFSQFYRSPKKAPPKVEEDEQTLIGNRIKRPGERKKTQKHIMNTTGKEFRRNRNNIASYNIDRSRGKIELDPKYKSIDFSNDDYESED